MEAITQRQGEIVGRQNPRPNSSISARRDGYICSCDNGAYCDGVCYFKSAPTTSIENNNNAISHAAAGRSSADPFSETEIYAELRRLTEELNRTKLELFAEITKRKRAEAKVESLSADSSAQQGSIDSLMAENAQLKGENTQLKEENKQLQAQISESDSNLALALANEGTITTPGSNALSTAPRSVEVIQTPARPRAQAATPIQNMINNYGTIHVHMSAGESQQPTRSGSYTSQESKNQYTRQPAPKLKYMDYPGDVDSRRRVLRACGYNDEYEISKMIDTFREFDKALRAKGYTCDK